MKTSIVTLAICLGLNFAQAQHLKETEVPQKVQKAFSEKYPGVKAKWEKEQLDYEAAFDLDKIESSALFDANGMFKEFEQEIKPGRLPAGATEYCFKNFTGYKLSEAAKITDASGKIFYEAEMKNAKEEFDAVFDEKGNFVKRSAPSIKKAG
jgi:hypothetical protein